MIFLFYGVIIFLLIHKEVDTMIDQEVLLLKDLMNHVDSSKREALLNLQKELSLRPDLKIKSYDGRTFI